MIHGHLRDRRSILPRLSAAFALALAGCGGGGGGAPPPPPANSAPAFTSAATANVPENSGGTIYTATASDADGDALTFSLSGGADQARFRITAAGALAFEAPPDFESPADANRDNAYLVQISVSDGTNTGCLSSSARSTPLGAPPSAHERIKLISRAVRLMSFEK